MIGDSIAQQELQSFVRRIESVEDEIKALNEDKSEIYKEARNGGFDVKVLRKVIAARRMDADERREQGEIFELYWDAIHGASERVVRAHVENIDEFPVEHDEDGVFPDDIGNTDTTEPRDPAPQESAQDDGAFSAVKGSARLENAIGVEPSSSNSTHERASTDDEASPEAGPQAEASLAGTGTGTLVDREARIEGQAASADLPTNITALRPPKPFRPNCLNRENCGGQGPVECWSCTKAAAQHGASA